MRPVIRSLEMFCGTGGLALGLHQAGFEPTALLEWDKDSCDNIKLNIAAGFPGIADWNVVQSDVRTVRFGEYGLDIQFVTGGPPCQPFSLGGKHRAHADTRDMFPEAVRAVRELRPKGFIFENVKGLHRKSFSTYFNYILLQLSHPEVGIKDGMDWTDHLKILEEHHTAGSREELGYNVVFRLVNAADYGVPQQRHRVVIVGFRNDLGVSWSFPAPTHSKEALDYAKFGDGSYWEEHGVARTKRPKQVLQDNGIQVDLFSEKPLKRWRTVRDAIAGLPDPRNGCINGFANHEFKEGARSYAGHSGSDFFCRFLVVDDIWIPLAESMLIERFKPVWNRVLEGFGNHDPGKGRQQGMMPQWDGLHPGRAWAARLQPCANTADELAERVKQYLIDAFYSNEK